MIVGWSQYALDDLKEIFADHVDRHGPLVAVQQVQRIAWRIAQIEQFPESGRVVPEWASRLSEKFSNAPTV